MRILIVTQYFWPEDFRINALVRALGACGRQLTVLTGKPNYPDGQVFSGYTAWETRRELYGDAEVMRVPLVRVAESHPYGWRLTICRSSFPDI